MICPTKRSASRSRASIAASASAGSPIALSARTSEINVREPGDGAMPAEFDAWRWEALERLPELIVPFKRAAYLEVVAAFRDLPARLRGR